MTTSRVRMRCLDSLQDFWTYVSHETSECPKEIAESIWNGDGALLIKAVEIQKYRPINRGGHYVQK